MTQLPYDPITQSWLRSATRAADWFEARLDGRGHLPGELHDLGSYYKWPLFSSPVRKSPSPVIKSSTIV